jgi:hypothetical protein
MDDMKKRKLLPLPGLELRPPGRPARSQSLYRLSYSGSTAIIIEARILSKQVKHEILINVIRN